MEKPRTQICQQANEYLDICNNGDKLFVAGKDTNYKGYTVIATPYDKDTNFKGVFLQKGNEYVLYCFGTNFLNYKDHKPIAAMLANKTPRQFEKAEEFLRKMMQVHGILPFQIIVIGNSEGGSEAIYLKAIFNVREVYTFNGYIPNLDNYNMENLQSGIYNFRTIGDVVSKFGASVGQDFIVGLKPGTKLPLGKASIKTWHQIITMGDCMQAVTVEEYKRNNPHFRHKFRKGKLMSYEIEAMPTELYPLFDADVKDRLAHGAVVLADAPAGYSITGFSDDWNRAFNNISRAYNSNCAGTYLVSGYTRDDGTRVPSYYRTCGAEHNS